MNIVKRIRRALGCVIALPGAWLWQPAFDEHREEKYENLRWSEKVGYHIVDFGIGVVAGMTQEDINDITNKYENK